MYGVSDGAREALGIIAQGGALRYQHQRNYWSMHGALDMRFVRSLLKRELVRERPAANVPKATEYPLLEAYLTESGRYVLANPQLTDEETAA